MTPKGYIEYEAIKPLVDLYMKQNQIGYTQAAKHLGVNHKTIGGYGNKYIRFNTADKIMCMIAGGLGGWMSSPKLKKLYWSVDLGGPMRYMTTDTNCERCGAFMKDVYLHKKYCSDECRIKAARGRVEKMPRIDKECAECKTIMSGVVESKKFCGKSCRDKFHGRRSAERKRVSRGLSPKATPRTDRPCEECGATMQRPTYNQRYHKTCRQIVRRRESRESKRRTRATQRGQA